MQAGDVKALTQNLRDAGCDDEMTGKIMELIGLGKINEATRLCAKHRDVLLGKVHRGEKNIDCLDYFVYMLKKEKERSTK